MSTTNKKEHECLPLVVSDFSENLFWDVDPATLDVDRHLAYIVARVVQHGTLKDWQALCRLKPLSVIVEVARTIRTLDPKSLAFLSVIADLPRERFRCYTPKHLMPKHWSY